MKVLILGGSGMLGHEVWKRFSPNHEVWVTLRRPVSYYARFGLFDERFVVPGFHAGSVEEIVRAIKLAKPNVIINCIGIIKQLKEAKDPIPSIEINSLLPHKIADVAQVAGARVVHLSTDCVFSGRNGNYKETDIPDAEDLYGRTKLLGELHGSNALTIRSSIIGHEIESANGLMGWFLSQEGKTIKGFTNAIYSGFTTQEMARIIEQVLTSHPELHGLWQVSSEPINKYELLKLAQQSYGWSGEIVPDDSFKCDRSLNSDRFRGATGYQPPSWQAMIAEMAQARAGALTH